MNKHLIYRTIAAGVLAAGMADGANAAIANGVATFGNVNNSNSSGELFLSVWDETAALSYSLDLGVSIEALAASATTPRTWALDQRFVDFAASGNPLKFNVAANNTYGTITSPAVGPLPSTYGVLTSILPGADEAKAQALANTSANAKINIYTSRIQQRVNLLNASAIATLLNGSPAGSTEFAKFGANLSEVTDGTADTYHSYFDYQWGKVSGNFPFITTATVGDPNAPDQSLALYFLGLTAPSVNKLGVTNLGAGTMFLTLDIAHAQLQWAASVPVPTAVWLFGSALSALAFIRRRAAC